MSSKENEKTFESFAGLLSEGHLRELEEIGHNFIVDKHEGNYIFDEDGKRYIDCDNNEGCFVLGRHNQELAEELRVAMHETEQGNFPMISVEKANLAKALADFAPGNLECSVFSVVRGETIEFACKLARGYCGRAKLLSIGGSWHGETGFAVSLSDRANKDVFAPLVPDCQSIAFGNIDEAREQIDKDTAAVIIEPLQVHFNCRQQSSEYLYEIKRLCKKNKTLLIFDETNTAFGSSGYRFLCDYYNIVPDMLVTGEALGAGIFPIAATIITQEVNQFLNQHPMIHLSTFGGSDLGCRVALKTLEIYQRDKPWRETKRLGFKLMEGLETIIAKQDKPVIFAADGMGFLVSLDLGTREKAKSFCKRLAENGLLAKPANILKRCVILRPAVISGEEMIDEILKIVENTCNETHTL